MGFVDPTATTTQTTTQTTPGGARPSGGNLKDPTYAASLVTWASQQPGADPSLKNDPNYWVQKITSGEFGADEGFIYDKMANAWKGGGNSSSSSASGTGMYDPETLAKIKEAFLTRLGGLQTPITADSPTVSGAIGANNLLTDRTLQEAKTASAERAYAKGDLNTAGYDQAQQQSIERAGGMKAAFAGNAVSQAENQRQSLLNQMLGLGGSMTSGSNSNQLGYDNLGFNYANLQNQMNRDAMLAALGVYGG